MSKEILTREISYEKLQRFFDDKPFVLFATGTSCAVDLAFGMGALENHLKNEVPNCGLNTEQTKEWESVLNSLKVNSDFEAAMNAIKDEQLLKVIIEKTATHVANIDQKNALEILSGTKLWTAIAIFKRLLKGLPETDRILHVATPNYDLLAEYAFSHAGIPYTTGFWGGVIRQLDWTQAERQMTYVEKAAVGRKLQNLTRIKKHIRLYKVHGSLNTFKFNNEKIETNLWIMNSPESVERLMITPGQLKHECVNNNRDALLHEYDKAIRSHNSFLFLGFGFNDTHLVNNAITDKLKKQSSPALIITRDWSPKIQDLLDNSNNAWLICKYQDNNSTRIYNRNYKDWLYLPDKELWHFELFATEIMGN
jgi:hypothetical protein